MVYFLFCLGFLFSCSAWSSVSFTNIVVFGDSLSDSGNAYVLSGKEHTPPYDSFDRFLVPTYPYAVGQHRYCNGPTWIEQFAEACGLSMSAKPAFAVSDLQYLNFAVGEARARNTSDVGVVNLAGQIDEYLLRVRGEDLATTLFVLEIGANDVRDAIVLSEKGEDPSSVMADAIHGIVGAIQKLYAQGARKFLLWNVPNMSQAPAIQALDAVHPGMAERAKNLTERFNRELQTCVKAVQKQLSLSVVELDAYTQLNHMVAHPETYHLRVVATPCIIPNSEPSHHQSPDTFLFWDGIHPTRVFHTHISKEAIKLFQHT